MGSSADSRFDVVYREIHEPNQNSITIVPIGDVHYNAPMFARSEFLAWCRKYKHRTDCWFIGLGDYLETFSTSERKALQMIHESSNEWLDEKVVNDVNEFAEHLSFTKGRWLGMLEGNHAYRTGDGFTTTELLCQRLQAQPLGVMAAIRCGLRFKKHVTRYAFDIWAHHGQGAGQLMGSTINSLEKFANGFIGDLYLMGHDHGIGYVPMERLFIGGTKENPTVNHKTAHLVRSGSFLKAYDPGKSGYIARCARKPRHLGTPEIKVENHQGHRGNMFDYIDAHVTI